MSQREPLSLSARPPGRTLRRRAVTALGSVAIATATALTLAGTGPATATPATRAVPAASAASAAAHSPHGAVHVSVKNHLVHVWGSAGDRDTRRALTVRVRLNRIATKSVRTNPRTHHYNAWLQVPTGTRYLRVSVVNAGAGHTRRIGAKWVTVHRPQTRNPHGTVRVVRAHHQARFSGRAWDPDTPGRSVTVLLWRNSTLVRRTSTDARTGRFAFGAVRIRPGANEMTVVAVNRWSGDWNTHLRRVELTRVAPWMLRYHGNRRIAAMMLPHYGWGPAQMRALNVMWNGESGWRTHAENSYSGAYGIPQAYPAGKMASAGRDWRTNPATQIRWGLNYIKARYGSPIGAWHSHLRTGSY